MLLIPSVDVVKGEPHALPGTFHLLMMAGGLAAVIPGIPTEDWARLKANYCFTAVPGPSGIESVTGGNERIVAVTGDAADSPDRAAVGAGAGARGPCCYAGWVVYRHAHQPAMIKVAILHAAIADVKNVIHDGECRSLLLDLRSENSAVVCSCRLHVHRPAGIRHASIQAKGQDEMLLSSSTVGRDHCIQKERTRSKIDNRRAGDAHGLKLRRTRQIL